MAYSNQQEELDKVYAAMERIAALSSQLPTSVPVSRDELLLQSAALGLAINIAKDTLRKRSKK